MPDAQEVNIPDSRGGTLPYEDRMSRATTRVHIPMTMMAAPCLTRIGPTGPPTSLTCPMTVMRTCLMRTDANGDV